MFIEKFKEAVIKSTKTSTKKNLGEDALNRIQWMFSEMSKGPVEAMPSKYWHELNRMNVEQLKENGFENFKKTITLNYFTWTRLLPWDNQIVFLCKQLSLGQILSCVWRTLSTPRHNYFSSLSPLQSLSYNFLSLLLWEYIFTLKLPPSHLSLREPELGNPALIFPKEGMAVSQDLGNSLVELNSMTEVVDFSKISTVLELGAGYGRNAYTVLKVQPGIKYVIVDIAPALWVSEKYLSEQFPDKKIFRAKAFQDFKEVEAEVNGADIVFLLANQLELMPPQYFDLTLTISSIHEMRNDQIAYYFKLFDRTLKTGGYFYYKQWRTAKVLFEGITLTEADYPIPSTWSKIYSRVARVQTKFFEALYRKQN